MMASILDMVNDPRQAFLTNLATGLLSAGGPSSRPVSLGQAFGAALPGALQGAQQAQTFQAQQEEARRAQMAEAQKQQDIAAFVSSLPPEQQAIARANPNEAIKAYFAAQEAQRTAMQPKFETVFTPEGREQKAWVSPQGFTPVGGMRAPSTPLVTVNTGKEFESEFLKDQSKQLDAAYSVAQGARSTALAAQQVLSALENNPYTGPGSTFKVVGAQVFGNDPERLLATRQAVQGLAKISVGARKQLQGQGTITDNEATALDKAESGNIDNMTIDEIRLAAQGAEKVALYNLKQYEKRRTAFAKAAKSPLVQDLIEAQKIEDISPYQSPQKSFPMPSNAAINKLKMQPSLRRDFDAKFGAGAADRVLGAK